MPRVLITRISELYVLSIIIFSLTQIRRNMLCVCVCECAHFCAQIIAQALGYWSIVAPNIYAKCCGLPITFEPQLNTIPLR